MLQALTNQGQIITTLTTLTTPAIFMNFLCLVGLQYSTYLTLVHKTLGILLPAINLIFDLS